MTINPQWMLDVIYLKGRPDKYVPEFPSFSPLTPSTLTNVATLNQCIAEDNWCFL